VVLCATSVSAAHWLKAQAGRFSSSLNSLGSPVAIHWQVEQGRPQVLPMVTRLASHARDRPGPPFHSSSVSPRPSIRLTLVDGGASWEAASNPKEGVVAHGALPLAVAAPSPMLWLKQTVCRPGLRPGAVAGPPHLSVRRMAPRIRGGTSIAIWGWRAVIAPCSR